jgi:UDP-GlcNAc:undecaprenyl-phosphate GlcNAc-1-phosphate transferase
MEASVMLISIITFGLVYILIGKAIMPVIESFLKGHEFVRSSYTKEVIPTGTGLFLYVMLIVESMLLLVWPKAASPYFNALYPVWGPSLSQFLVWAGIILWAGWVDDTKGSQAVKGFKGHVGALIQGGIVTTGLVKAAIAVAVGLWVAIQLGGAWYEGTLRFVVIVLSTNALNLLDLRPGRATKSFYLGSIPLFIWSDLLLFIPYWLPLAVAALLILPRDLGGRVMLGDTGANLLGFGLGFSLAVAAPIQLLMLMCVLLILLHWAAERSSLTAMIERNGLLNRIDQWGRAR